MRLSRPVPLWLFLIGLLVVGAGSAAVYYGPRLFSPKPDFQLSFSPSTVTVRPESVLTSASFYDGNGSASSVTVRSLNGFTGSVSLSATFPSGISGSLTSSTILLGSDAALFSGNASTTIRLASTAYGEYSVQIVATSGGASHSASLQVHSQDVSMQQGQKALSIVQGTTVTSTITFSSVNQFAGNLTLSEQPTQIYHGGFPYYGYWFVNASLSTNAVQLRPGSTASVNLTIGVGNFMLPMSYNFSTIAVYSSAYSTWMWQEQITVTVVAAGEPSLALIGHSLNSATNATLALRNGGPASILINYYNVTDSTGDSVTACLAYPWSMSCGGAVIINAASTGGVNLCLNCAYSFLRGSAFIFQSGKTYTVHIGTSRGNVFSYSVTL